MLQETACAFHGLDSTLKLVPKTYIFLILGHSRFRHTAGGMIKCIDWQQKWPAAISAPMTFHDGNQTTWASCDHKQCLCCISLPVLSAALQPEQNTCAKPQQGNANHTPHMTKLRCLACKSTGAVRCCHPPSTASPLLLISSFEGFATSGTCCQASMRSRPG